MLQAGMRRARCSAFAMSLGVWWPLALLVGLLAAPVAFFHYVTEGPKEPQPPVQEVPR